MNGSRSAREELVHIQSILDAIYETYHISRKYAHISHKLDREDAINALEEINNNLAKIEEMIMFGFSKDQNK